MGLILLFARITCSSFDLKYKAPGFDIFQKSNENGSLTLFFMIFFACVLLKRIFLNNMNLFGQAIFRGLARLVKSSKSSDFGFNGCIFSTFAHLTMVEFYVNFSFVDAGKAQSVCQSLVLSIM